MNLRVKRLQKFHNLKNDIWYSKQVKKLKRDEFQICLDWLEQYGDSPDYGLHVNRIFVENFQDRKTGTKKDSLIWELLSVCMNVN